LLELRLDIQLIKIVLLRTVLIEFISRRKEKSTSLTKNKRKRKRKKID